MENITNDVYQVPVNQPVFDPEKPKTNYFVIALVLVVFALFLFGAYVLGRQSTVKPELLTAPPVIEVSPTNRPVAILPSSVQIPSLIPTIDPMAGWKTYDKTSFSVKAPSQLQYQEQASNQDLLSLSESIPADKTPEKGVDISFGYQYGNGIVKCATNDDCFNIIDTSNKGAKSAGSKTVVTQISATIAGQTIKGFRSVNPPSDTLNSFQVKMTYPISHNGNFFEIDFNAFGKSESEVDNYLNSLDIDQILSTFRFTK